jgi:two-component system, NarL family, nitrate/nitrite response regulator NarL
MSARARVVLADDHPMFLEALVLALRHRQDLELVASVSDGRSALSAIVEHRPDVAMVDMHMPGLTGLQVLNAVQRDGLPTRLLFLSAAADGETVFAAMAAGAAGYLPKESGRDQILDALAAVARGGVVISPGLQASFARELQLRQATDRPVLTARELEILKLTAQGLSGPQVALQLHLSPATIKTHLQSVYEKLEVSDRAAAVAVAMRRGLLE